MGRVIMKWGGGLISDKSIYENLESATKELEELIQDMKINPERYINFSIINTPKPYKKPKSE